VTEISNIGPKGTGLIPYGRIKSLKVMLGVLKDFRLTLSTFKNRPEEVHLALYFCESETLPI
jgi:hypothetical protein